MDLNRLHGAHYVRLAPGAACAVAPYIGADPGEIEELLLDLAHWPVEIKPPPLRALDGRLIAGDPVLAHADDRGLWFLAGSTIDPRRAVPVPWSDVRDVQVLGRRPEQIGA